MAARTPPGRLRLCSAAHRYMLATRTPPAPAVMASTPTVIVSVRSPSPAVPTRRERKT